MKIKMIYVAKDGTEFTNKEDCELHEKKLDVCEAPVIKNRISGMENHEGYSAELYLIKTRADYEIVFFYLSGKTEHLTSNFNLDNFGWFISWSQLNEDGSTEQFLLNYNYYFRNLYDNLMLLDGRIQEEISKRDPTKEEENNTTEKTVKESELQYPTWREWQRENFPNASETFTPCTFKSVDELGCTGTSCSTCEFNPIPADLAKKLGIKPKKG